MRDKRRKWRLKDKPRTSSSTEYNEYKEAKRLFRNKHRFYAEQYLSSLNDEIDNAAELDPRTFWRLYSKRKYNSSRTHDSVMVFDIVTYRDPKDVTYQWGIYFKYRCNPDSNGDQPAINHINEWVSRVRSESCLRVEDRFNIDDISKSVLRLNKNKTCSQDSIFNEHIIYGGKT